MKKRGRLVLRHGSELVGQIQREREWAFHKFHEAFHTGPTVGRSLEPVWISGPRPPHTEDCSGMSMIPAPACSTSTAEAGPGGGGEHHGPSDSHRQQAVDDRKTTRRGWGWGWGWGRMGEGEGGRGWGRPRKREKRQRRVVTGDVLKSGRDREYDGLRRARAGIAGGIRRSHFTRGSGARGGPRGRWVATGHRMHMRARGRLFYARLPLNLAAPPSGKRVASHELLEGRRCANLSDRTENTHICFLFAEAVPITSNFDFQECLFFDSYLDLVRSV
ncbi:hypothetical protein MARPO_0034s0018 [Marchantia polymorpha]|uniref:Uncharacterized protein n=1 Tax=Marchantia polymorpha TaxID=3197 RepID=A0A2R6X5M5_MARPO|nr:hypothetical protein MARPO_0034s0018 [Marchantia polymorpha]|eukprot:PTQ41410.1 hypothetical protein MARPO_0034s0018 [Marchantia polymorpha]